MLDYGSFCYLQNQKTGGTFVEGFLRKCSNQPLLHYKKHEAVAERVPGKFYFTNVREPLALYRSLYAYGLEGKGTVFVRLEELGLSRLYADGPAGFEDWLKFVLQPRFGPVLANAYTPAVARWVGFMTWRFLRLACHGFEVAAAGFSTSEQAGAYIRQNYMLGRVLRQENLRAELAQLAQGPLSGYVKDMPAALQWLADSRPLNVSAAAAGVKAMPVSTALHERVVQCEKFTYQNFYPQLLEMNPHAT